jgi:hypothetical protein
MRWFNRIEYQEYLPKYSPSNALAFASGPQVVICREDGHANPVPRVLRVGETPRRVLFFKHLNVLVTAATCRLPASPSYRGSRTDQENRRASRPHVRSTLRFLDPVE